MMASINRISGMASGLDTDTLVKKMMTAESIGLNKMKQNQQKLTWQSDGYRQWNSDIFSFRSTTLFNMKLSSAYNTFSTTSSSPDSLSGTATADAVEGTYSYEVLNLAQSATMKSNIDIDQTKALSNTPTTLTLMIKDQTGTSRKATVVIANTDKIADVVTKLNTLKDASGNGMGLKAIYDSTLKQFILNTKDTSAQTQISLSSSVAGFLDTTLGFKASADSTYYVNGFNGSAGVYVTAQAPNATRVPDTNTTINTNYVKGTTGLVNMSAAGSTTLAKITVDGTSFDVSAALNKDWTTGGTKLTDVVNALKNVSSGATILSDLVDITTDGTDLSFKSKSTGTSSTIVIDAGTGTMRDAVANLFSVDTASHVTTDLGVGKIIGNSASLTNPNIPRDAKIKFNGTVVTAASNNVKILGVNYTLKNVIAGTNKVTITKDTDTVVKNIKDFVSKYNDMLAKLNTAINETVYKDFQPLTDDQRTAMSETQITTWETKAKSGLFRNDSSLNELVNIMRLHITSTVDNGSTYNSLASIGIASQSYVDKGKLYIDETKLRAAIQADPEAVKNLFSQSPSNATSNVKQGLTVRLYDDFQSAFTKLKNKAGSTGNSQYDQSIIGKVLIKTSLNITTEQGRLSTKESKYYAKFTAMEKAMSKYQSQSSYLSQYLLGSKG
jgi:flagellar hook-associated protein 2